MNLLDFDEPVTLSMGERGGPWLELATDKPLVAEARKRRRRAEAGDDDDAGVGLALALARDPALAPIVKDAYRRRLAESKRLEGNR